VFHRVPCLCYYFLVRICLPENSVVRSKGAFSLLGHRYFRGIVLGLMIFLAGTAFCSTDSYDPNPYDDIPPVVTVEFNYVVPGQLSQAIVRTAFTRGGQHALGYVEIHRAFFATSADLEREQVAPVSVPEIPEGFLPLRR